MNNKNDINLQFNNQIWAGAVIEQCYFCRKKIYESSAALIIYPLKETSVLVCNKCIPHVEGSLPQSHITYIHKFELPVGVHHFWTRANNL